MSLLSSVVLSPVGVAKVLAAAALLIAAAPLVFGRGLSYGIRLFVVVIVAAAMLCAVGATIDKGRNYSLTTARAMTGITDARRRFPLATMATAVLAVLASVWRSSIARFALALRLFALRLAERTAARRPLPTPA